MGKFRIYISCPISILEITLHMYVKAAEKLGTEVDYWRRGTSYCERGNIEKCDAFILVLPSEEFKHSIERLPAGCKQELMLAQRHGKNIYIAYRPMTAIPSFYEADIRHGLIGGIDGSSRMLASTIIKHIGEEMHTDFYKCLGTTEMNPCSEVYISSMISSDIKPILINVPRI